MSFTVIEIDGSSEFIRGTLQRRLLEIRPGLFVGSVPARVRDDIWTFILDDLRRASSALMIYPNAKNESGFSIRTHGDNRRIPVDFGGVWLVQYKKKKLVDSEAQRAESIDTIDDW